MFRRNPSIFINKKMTKLLKTMPPRIRRTKAKENRLKMEEKPRKTMFKSS